MSFITHLSVLIPLLHGLFLFVFVPLSVFICCLFSSFLLLLISLVCSFQLFTSNTCKLVGFPVMTLSLGWKFLESEPCFGHLTCKFISDLTTTWLPFAFRPVILTWSLKMGAWARTRVTSSGSLASSSHNRSLTPACVRSPTSWVWAARRLLFRLWQWRSQGRTTPTGIFVQQATRWGLEIQSELNIGAAVLTLTHSDSVLVPVLPSSSPFASALLCRHRLTFIFFLFYLPLKLQTIERQSRIHFLHHVSLTFKSNSFCTTSRVICVPALLSSAVPCWIKRVYIWSCFSQLPVSCLSTDVL